MKRHIPATIALEYLNPALGKHFRRSENVLLLWRSGRA